MIAFFVFTTKKKLFAHLSISTPYHKYLKYTRRRETEKTKTQTYYFVCRLQCLKKKKKVGAIRVLTLPSIRRSDPLLHKSFCIAFVKQIPCEYYTVFSVIVRVFDATHEDGFYSVKARALFYTGFTCKTKNAVSDE